MTEMKSFNEINTNDSKIIIEQHSVDSIDEKNKEFIKRMKEEGVIAHGLINGSVPITLNNLIDFCKSQNIDFDSPIFLECSDGYFPLTYYHKAEALDCLIITNGEH